MKIVPISKFLTDFGKDLPSGHVHGREQVQEQTANRVEALQQEKMLQEQIDETILATVSDVRKEIEAEFEAQLAEEKRLSSIRFREQTVALENEFSERLVEQLTSGLDRIETKISNLAASVLKRLVADSIEGKITNELKRTIEKVVRDVRGGQIILRGREVRLEKLQQKLGGLQDKILFVVQDSSEVTVEADDVWIESQFTSWLELIDSAGAK